MQVVCLSELTHFKQWFSGGKGGATAVCQDFVQPFGPHQQGPDSAIPTHPCWWLPAGGQGQGCHFQVNKVQATRVSVKAWLQTFSQPFFGGTTCLKFAIFTRDYSRKRKESVWAAFLNLLNRPDGFIQNMTSRWPLNLVFTVDLIFCSTRVVAKMACWSPEQMQGSDLQ